jgi:hypothetical protein
VKPVLARTWEGTWWHRTTATIMLAILLLATWQAVRSIGDESREPTPIRRAYDSDP